MKFASVRIITADIGSMVAFYEMVTRIKAQWLAPVFAEIVLPGATLAIGAIGAVETVALWQEGSAAPATNRSLVIELQVDDIQSEYARLKDSVVLVHELKTMPWGNATFQFRDPEGNAVSLYMPASEDAKRRFALRSA
ncbi:glyoxalase/bleomycin resistance/extradiol dioxygenase family protein [Inquilinus sp. Marseille-Q2685]|uniref:VOC family protein n=1 Tax=Inquilinus sp. Marseille-Q2685 TaxID=2866581 RepID=UPI001CE3CF81|nr:VOC family protein [Inquilinus sp. Marseille-Q2685]